MKQLLNIFIISLLYLSAKGQISELPSAISNYALKNNFNGTVLVEKDSTILYHQSFGIANRAFDIPVTNETEYKICSITKSFTAVLILQLYEEGKIDLSKKIIDYLPDYKGEGGDKVSIHQLLNHTSGIMNTDTVSSIENAFKYGIGFYQKPYSSTQLVDLFCSGPLVAKPGAKFDYNNGDYMILGKILEKIYKMPYGEILDQKIFSRLSMHHSGLLSQDKLIKKLASTYFINKGLNSLVPDLPVYYQDWFAAGSMYSKSSDLLIFFNALFDLKLIKKDTLKLMLTPGLDDYGYGVWIRDYKGSNSKYKRMERYGSIMGANSVVFRHLENDLTVILLSNTNMTDLGAFALNIGKQVF